MYEIFYGMREKPFENNINPNIFFSSPTHNEAWQFVLDSLNSNDIYVLIVGEYGVGKTLLCNCLMEHLNKYNDYHFVFVPHPNLSYKSILKMILKSTDPMFKTENVEEMQDRIIELISNQEPLRQLLLILDDVQDMDLVKTLPSLLSFGKIAAKSHPLLKIIMFAHIYFLKLLAFPDMEAYNQRIRLRYTLTPLDLSQTKEYIYFRMIKSGAKGVPRFDDTAISMIHRYSKGIPRLINNLCDICLRIGALQKSLVIDGHIVANAIQKIQPDEALITPAKLETVESKEPITQGEPIKPKVEKEEIPSHPKIQIAISQPEETRTDDQPLSEAEQELMRRSKSDKKKYKANIIFMFIIGILLIILGLTLYFRK